MICFLLNRNESMTNFCTAYVTEFQTMATILDSINHYILVYNLHQIILITLKKNNIILRWRCYKII